MMVMSAQLIPVRDMAASIQAMMVMSAQLIPEAMEHALMEFAVLHNARRILTAMTGMTAQLIIATPADIHAFLITLQAREASAALQLRVMEHAAAGVAAVMCKNEK